MNLWFRLALAILAGVFGKSIRHSETTERRFRVLPQDLDLFGHMNNGRYLQIMDVARVHWMARLGVVQWMWRVKCGAVLGGGFVRYRRALKLWHRYSVHTRLLGWDERWWYLEHVFRDDQNRLAAVGVARAALRSREGWVKTDDVARRIDPTAESPRLPLHVIEWQSVEDAMCKHVERRAFSEQRQAS